MSGEDQTRRPRRRSGVTDVSRPRHSTALGDAELAAINLRKRGLFPLVVISLMMAAYKVAAGVLPPGDFQ
jgi:hypothetical protein